VASVYFGVNVVSNGIINLMLWFINMIVEQPCGVYGFSATLLRMIQL